MRTLQRIADRDVDLRPVERTIAGVHLPRVPERVQRLLQLTLGAVPRLDLAKEARRTCGQLELEGEAEDAVDVLEEIQTAFDLLFDLKCTAVGSPERSEGCVTCDCVQKMCASSCWNRRTRVRPLSAPDASFRCRTPKSAMRRGSSRHERSRDANMRLKHNATC